MIERWRTTTTLLYIAVLWSCICCDNVCLADGFKNLVRAFLDAHKLSNTSCPIELPLRVAQHISANLSLTATPSDSAHPKASSGNCTNNLTAPDSLRKATSVLKAESPDADSSAKHTEGEELHQPIATFDEWTKEKLKQELRKAVPPAASLDTGMPSTQTQPIAPAAATTRNYASRECGAKVLLSNAEAENTKAILNEKEKDEYMRNPCEKADNKFVIVELCETIQPRSIEIANYELFSSGPRNIRLWSAERFPNGEWRLLSDLTAADSRQIQQFPVPFTGAYAKFIKVELLSHYGSEHYCTLSVLKILGISMVDEYEAEAEAASVGHVPNSLKATSDGQENNVTSEAVETTTSPHTQSQPESGTKASDGSVVVKLAENKEESSDTNPTVIDLVDEVSGHLISKFVDVVKDKLGRGTDNSSRAMKECAIASPFSACFFCPKDRSYIYPRQFCKAFVWRSNVSTPSKRNNTRHPAVVARSGMSSLSRLRRSRFAFLQRKSTSYLHPDPSVTAQQQVVMSDAEKPQDTSSTKVSTSEDPQNQSQQHSKQQLSQTPSQNPRPSQPLLSDVLPASSMSHKESVFMKLNKRIAALELNMSLSSEYLSELSRQYVAQTDEHQKHLKQAKKVVEDAVEAIYARVNETLADKIAVLREEVNTLSRWLSSMRITASKVTLSRLRSQDRENEKCISQNQLHRYSPPDDGLWTTEQVVYMVVTTQLVTVLLLATLNFCYQRFTIEQPLSDDQRLQIEELVNERVLEAFEKNSSTIRRQITRISAWSRRSSRNDKRSLNGDECASILPESSSSSRLTNSDDSSTEEVAASDACSTLSSEVPAIASVA
ncbi:unnamed protein product [Cylicocyclus nassatus]|uniref:SUN domain-containing protein n=1 Tax=Cylicocyclus nassatus TaxID=53992 RepID=A0AA36MEQ9_CYLNA|nr:unnamed protein product [Cylicocyclus nassatus]